MSASAPIYATPAQLAAYLDPDATEPPTPPLATVLLRSASALVRDATKTALYNVDRATGLPTDQGILSMLADATCEQAAAWSVNGIDPRKGAGQVQRRVASKALGGASVSYVADPAADTYLSALASGQSLVLSAWTMLRNAGLIPNVVITAPGGGVYTGPTVATDAYLGQP